MQLQTLTSSSNEFIYVDRLDDLYKIASTLKCNVFIKNAYTGLLYGSYEEPYSIISTPVPIMFSDRDFMFASSMYSSIKAKEVMNKYKTFFYVPEFPMFLFPEYLRASFMNGNISVEWESYSLIDNTTGNIIEDAICAYMPGADYAFSGLMSNIAKFGSLSMMHYTDHYQFDNCQNDPVVMDVIQSKVSQGRKLMTLRTEDNVFAFYIFKSLLAPLTKQDKLTIRISANKFIPRKFIASFFVDKKSKLGIPEIAKQTICIDVPMLNLV